MGLFDKLKNISGLSKNRSAGTSDAIKTCGQCKNHDTCIRRETDGQMTCENYDEKN
jgi:hypothetical protein